MTDSVHQMSLLVGEIKGQVSSLRDSIDNLNLVWGQREQSASEGRRILHDKLETVQNDVARMEASVENATREISIIKPAIESFKTARDRQDGAMRLGKRLWLAFIGIAGLAGGAIAELVHFIRGH